MKDMFYNYDHNINKRLLSPKEKPAFFEPDKLLSSDPNVSIIQNVKGKEIGIKVKQGMPFTLYFYLDDYSTSERASDVDSYVDLLLNSTAFLEIISNKHKVVGEPIQAEAFNIETSELIVKVPQSTAKLLDKDSYRLRLTLYFPGGSYELYSENDGLLIVR